VAGYGASGFMSENSRLVHQKDVEDKGSNSLVEE
jgi:hypothetical protein